MNFSLCFHAKDINDSLLFDIVILAQMDSIVALQQECARVLLRAREHSRAKSNIHYTTAIPIEQCLSSSNGKRHPLLSATTKSLQSIAPPTAGHRRPAGGVRRRCTRRWWRWQHHCSNLCEKREHDLSFSMPTNIADARWQHWRRQMGRCARGWSSVFTTTQGSWRQISERYTCMRGGNHLQYRRFNGPRRTQQRYRVAAAAAVVL